MPKFQKIVHMRNLLFSGLRVGELLNLHMKDVRIEDDGYSVIVSGKTGQMLVFLMNPTYLQEFMRDMRRKASPDAWLFVKLQNGFNRATIRV